MNVSATNTSASRLEVRELCSVHALKPLYDQWRELWFRSNRTPFQSPMWLLPWMEKFAGKNLRVLLWQDRFSLRAIAPFYMFGEGSDTRLLIVGNGISDYLDICVDPAFAREVQRELANRLVRVHCEFNQLCGDSIVTKLGFDLAPGDPCPILDLHGKCKADYAPARQLEKLRYYRRRANKLADWRITRACRHNLLNTMHQLFRLHALRWSTRHAEGVLHDEQIQQFHIEAATNLCDAGSLRLYALELQNEVIGVLYAFADTTATHYYLSGFDPQFDKISPGTLLIGHAIENAICEGHQQFNFLRGAEPYKYSWGALDRGTFRLVI